MPRVSRVILFCAILICVAGMTGTALAEPHFLSKQYTRCATCHVSASGGGQLTPYGRSLSHVELSTFPGPEASHDAEDEAAGEEAFLAGVLGDTLGPLQLGIDLRPSRVRVSAVGTSSRNLLMTADLTASYRIDDWVLYGEVGRKLRGDGSEVDSHEYWVGRQPDEGFGFRVGRLLPAYGVKFADHTAFNRTFLGLAQYDQALALEASLTRGDYLIQASVGPGLADAVIDDDGRQATTATGRVQVDLGPRLVLVGSGLYRDESQVSGRQGAMGLALGVSTGPRLAIWTQLDGVFEEGTDATTYVITSETSFEAMRGVWLKVAPQAVLGGGVRVSDRFKLTLGAVLLPRTHWNINLSYSRDRNRPSRATTHVFLTQLHLYL